MKAQSSNMHAAASVQAAAKPQVDLERRRITVTAALALLGGATIALTSCSGGGGPTAPTAPPAAPPAPPPTSDCAPDAACGQIENNHGHDVSITSAQLTAGGGIVLGIRGMAPHSHIVELSADDVVAIREKRRVQKRSSQTFDHDHLITFN